MVDAVKAQDARVIIESLAGRRGEIVPLVHLKGAFVAFHRARQV
jgi:hypothetical protein